ncbi:SDR family NAD(P)-dependent oxidoreductase [Actinomycetospora endophytica]|uniref:SDR family NAD(P)-dependent oxidoreductase n=1 Tax=Actinomycetospora endophytica TaxID=2291215 RepID=A0ABS8P2Y9_9PSEU|nr:SDR family NAD(P)-dependent oxidoreductase [Actinomycetospora endophytica]MCD2192612.1 SDR family NAD(P)-dependent oxidoreductase [Actinomycetospora endophytica]
MRAPGGGNAVVMDIADRVVVITGASSGIGEATARLAHARGAHVVLAARRADRLETVAKDLPGSVAVIADVTRDGDRRAVVDAAVERLGGVDVLVNNAGRGLHLPLDQVDPADYAAILDLNVGSALAMMQAVLPSMRGRGGGAIVNISSGTTRRVIPGLGAYAATKSALNMLSAVAREEFAGDGIVVSTVLPTYTDSEFHDVLQAGATEHRAPVAADTSEHVAEEILRAVETGVAEIDLPRVG